MISLVPNNAQWGERGKRLRPDPLDLLEGGERFEPPVPLAVADDPAGQYRADPRQ